MATLSLTDQLTPVEVAKRFGDKNTIMIIETLAQVNELLLDAPTFEASDGTINRTTRRATLPTPTRRIYGQGIDTVASLTRQVEDRIEMIEAYSDIDADMADHSPNKAALMTSEDMAVIEGMGQTQIDDLLYAKASDGPEYLDGIFTQLDGSAAGKQTLVVETSGSNCASILLFKWGRNKAHLFYPRGIPNVGITREFRGKVDTMVKDSSGVYRKMPAYSTFFKSHFGWSMRDVKAVKRIANIVPGTSTAENIMKKLIEARNLLAPGEGTIVAYMNADVKTILDQYMQVTRSNYMFTRDDPWGRPVTQFGEIRIRQVDKLLSTESLVSLS